MALYYGRHKVRDYKEWRPYFDGDQKRLQSINVKLVSVMQSAGDPNDVHFVFDIPDFNQFVAMMQQPETQAIFQQAGVLEQPTVFKLDAMAPDH